MKRVVITGMGLINASGVGVERTWQDVLDQRSRLAPFQRWKPYEGCPIKVGSEVVDNLEDVLPRRSFAQTDRSIHLAAAALRQCIADSGLEEAQLHCSGLIYGTTLGQLDIISEIGRHMANGESLSGLPSAVIYGVSAVAGLVHLTVAFRIRGISYLVQQASASGAAAIGEAFDKIRTGRATAIFAGSGDNSFSPVTLAFYQKRNCIPKDYHNRAPADLVIPFCDPAHSDRIGVGEAGTVILLEDMEHAQRRGARIYAEVLGTGTYQYNENLTGRDEDGIGMTQALTQLPREHPVEDAVMTIMGLQFADNTEYRHLSRCLDRVHAFTSEPLYGHLTSPGGIMNVMLGAQMLRTGVVPATRNVRPEWLDTPGNVAVLTEPLNRKPERVLITVRGYGGYNCAVLLGKA